MCQILGVKPKSKASVEKIDESIIESLATGLKTYYRLQEETEARIQYSLPRLENTGLIKAYEVKDWGPRRYGRKKRVWGLSTRGFIHFLSRHRKSIQPILRAVEAYQDLLTYQVTAPERPDYVEVPRYVETPVLPVRLQRIFRERVGDETYVRCLTHPLLETDLPRYDVILERARSSFKRGHSTIPPEIEDSFIREQEDLAVAFTLRFLRNIFIDVFGSTSRAFREPYLNKDTFSYLESLLNEEIKKLEDSEDRLRRVRDRALSFFNPDWKEPVETVCKEKEDVREKLFGYRRDEKYGIVKRRRVQMG